MSLHPNVHAAWQDFSNDETLHVAVAYSNPFRWETRRRLFHDFKHHMERTPNVVLHVGELAYGDRPFEVTGNDPNDVQLRTGAELFHKENILNEVIKRFPMGWKYGAYCDADFSFTRHDWALETIHQLQHAEWVQPFSTYANLSARKYGGQQPGKVTKGFAATYIDNGHALPYNAGFADRKGYAVDVAYGTPWVPVGATGGAWAFKRSAFEAVGGLLDQAILGHGDWFMAFGLVGAHTQGDIANSPFHPHYTAMIEAWQARAAAIKGNIGVVDQFAVHHFHGAIRNRGYESRDRILVKYQFDPVFDLRKNWQGVYELSGNKSGLRDAIRRYFVARNEDDITE